MNPIVPEHEEGSEASWWGWYEELTPSEKRAIERSLAGVPLATPTPGPQTMAYQSRAEVIGYGGNPGGGKTALLALLALTAHQRSLVIREDSTQLAEFVEVLEQFAGTSVGLNRQKNIFRLVKGTSFEGELEEQLDDSYQF